MSESGLEVRTEEGAVVFPVRVAPRVSRSAIAGLHGGALKVALTAPPVEGAANAALVKLLAKKLGVAKSAVTIVRGERGRDKQVRVAGVDAAAARALAR